MRILFSAPEGRVVVNPPDVTSFADLSPGGGAAVVIYGRDVVLSTVFADHNSMMELAGFTLENFVPGQTAPETATFRGGLRNGRLGIDIWHQEGLPDDLEEHIASLQVAFDFIADHPRLRHVEAIRLTVFDEEYVEVATFSEAGLVFEQSGRPGLDR